VAQVADFLQIRSIEAGAAGDRRVGASCVLTFIFDFIN
jgi:hypothetical protein